MRFLIPFIALIACEDNFDKGGEEIDTTTTGEPGSEPSVEINPDNPDDPNHDWDEDGFTENEGDCNDYNEDINPEIEEIYYDSIDGNCDELSDFDADQDGHIAFAWGGDDCDDLNEEAYPGAVDDPTDGIDTDCDGKEDPRFVLEEIDPNTLLSNGSNAMDIDSTGKLHVVYEDDGQLWYTNSAELGSWRTPTRLKFNDEVTLGSHGIAGAIDSNDVFHLTYTQYNANTSNLALFYGYMETVGNWIGNFEIDGENTTFSTEVGFYPDLAVGPDNLPVFGYYNQNVERPFITKLASQPLVDTEPEFLYRNEADYLIYNSSGKGTGLYTSLVVDSLNRSHIMYLDETSAYGTGNDPQTQYSSYGDYAELCSSAKVTSPGGYWHSVAIRPDGQICVAYQNKDTLNLEYACQTGTSCTSWDVQTVDANTGTGAYAALAFNSFSQPYIAYYDANKGNLKIATQQGLNWELDIIDDGSIDAVNKDVGRFSNIAIDSEDKVHIIYQNATDQSLWHAFGR